MGKKAASTNTRNESATGTSESPDYEGTMISVSIALRSHLLRAEEGGLYPPIFCELTVPLTPDAELPEVVNVEDVYAFLVELTSPLQLDPLCVILCLVYIERAVRLSDLKLCYSNWCPVLLTSLILAAKVWYDEVVHIKDFVTVLPHLDMAKVQATAEAQLLILMQYRVQVSAQLYARYYFELRKQLRVTTDLGAGMRDFPIESSRQVQHKSSRAQHKSCNLCAASMPVDCML